MAKLARNRKELARVYHFLRSDHRFGQPVSRMGGWRKHGRTWNSESINVTDWVQQLVVPVVSGPRGAEEGTFDEGEYDRTLSGFQEETHMTESSLGGRSNLIPARSAGVVIITKHPEDSSHQAG